MPDTRWDSGFVDTAVPIWVVAVSAHAVALSTLLLAQYWRLGGKQQAKHLVSRLGIFERVRQRKLRGVWSPAPKEAAGVGDEAFSEVSARAGGPGWGTGRGDGQRCI